MAVTPFQNFLSQLDRGSFMWSDSDKLMACCPAHDDRWPSLMVSERSDGSVGFHCFAGCEKKHILDAIGLTWYDCFADGTDARVMTDAKGKTITYGEIAEAMAFAGIIVGNSADMMLAGTALTDSERDCLKHYRNVLLRADELINGRYKRR